MLPDNLHHASQEQEADQGYPIFYNSIVYFFWFC